MNAGAPDARAGQAVAGRMPGDDSDLAVRIAAAVTAAPEVAELSGGRLGSVATYGPGRPVRGVSVHDTDVEVRVVARPVRPLPEIAESVRQAVLPLAGDRTVNVVIEDLAAAPDGDSAGTDE